MDHPDNETWTCLHLQCAREYVPRAGGPLTLCPEHEAEARQAYLDRCRPGWQLPPEPQGPGPLDAVEWAERVACVRLARYERLSRLAWWVAAILVALGLAGWLVLHA